jgi:hypothetical protein
MGIDHLISAIDAEISKLQQARTLLSKDVEPTAAPKKRGRPAKSAKAAKPVKAVAKPAKAAKKKAKRTLSPEARKAIADAQRKRWAAQKAAAAKAAKKAPAKKVTAKTEKPVEPATPQS